MQIPPLLPHHKLYLILSSLALLAGILFYTIYNELIIFRWPTPLSLQSCESFQIRKKNAKLSYWYNNNWHQEEKELIESSNILTSVEYLITSWLNLLEEEHIMDKKISVQTILINATNQELSISFDRNPLNKNSAIFDKCMWIEALLKTLRDNNFTFTFIRLLVHHKPLHDPYIDFYHPLPISGFINT